MCEKCKISGWHWSMADYRQRVTRKDAQAILINHEAIIFHGRLHLIKVKSIGAGVYEIYKAPRPLTD